MPFPKFRRVLTRFSRRAQRDTTTAPWSREVCSLTKPNFGVLSDNDDGESSTRFKSSIDSEGNKFPVEVLGGGKITVTITETHCRPGSYTPAQLTAAREVAIEMHEAAILALGGSIVARDGAKTSSKSSSVQLGMFVRAMNVANLEDVFYGFLTAEDERFTYLDTYPDIPNTRVTGEKLPAGAYRLSHVHLPLEGTDGVIAHELEERLSSISEDEWVRAIPNFSQALLGHLACTLKVSGYDRTFIAVLQHLTDQKLISDCLFERHEELYAAECNFGLLVDRITDEALRQSLLLQLLQASSTSVAADQLASHDQKSLVKVIRYATGDERRITLLAYVALSFLTDESELVEFGEGSEGLPWAFVRAAIQKIKIPKNLKRVRTSLMRLHDASEDDHVLRGVKKILPFIEECLAQLTPQ